MAGYWESFYFFAFTYTYLNDVKTIMIMKKLGQETVTYHNVAHTIEYWTVAFDMPSFGTSKFVRHASPL
jgi:hypothetical protein